MGRQVTSRQPADGSMTVEVAVLAPVLFLFVLVAVGLGRFEGARQEVADAAHAGAEAASVVTGAAQAPGAAAEASSAALLDQPHMCVRPAVTTDLSAYVPGGSVRVTVDCHVDLSDLLIPGFPGSVVVRATETAPIDPYRAVG